MTSLSHRGFRPPFGRPVPPLALLAGLARGTARLPSRLLAALLHWQELHRQRRELLGLDDRLLRDIGVTRAEARREADRLIGRGTCAHGGAGLPFARSRRLR